MSQLPLTAALRMLAFAEMRPFSKYDWQGFSGCTSADPLIGEVDQHIVILDGSCLCIIDAEGNESNFNCLRVG